MGNTPSQSSPVTDIKYKKVYKFVAAAYNKQLADYNNPFTRIVSKNADGTLKLLFNPATIKYDPPRPVWADGVDPLFEIDIERYNAQLKQAAGNIRDDRMFTILNSPPVPMPVPVEILLEDPAPTFAGTPQSYMGSTNPLTAKYNLLYNSGLKYEPSYNFENYKNRVFYNPPTKDEIDQQKKDTVTRKFLILYEQIRALHASYGGNDAFDLAFINPYEGFRGAQNSREGFVGGLAMHECIDTNTVQQNWYLNQIIDVQARINMQTQYCAERGYKYDGTKCKIGQCVLEFNSEDTSEPPEPQTAQKYNYNRLKYSASQYPAHVNQFDYEKQLADMKNFKASDIGKYYDYLNDYNFYWMEQNGWREMRDKQKPYNPPLPPWTDKSQPAAAEKKFFDDIAIFNENVIRILREFNDYKQYNLPADFGAPPEPPAYPNALYNLLTTPKLFLTSAAAKNMVVVDESDYQPKYEVPVRQLPRLFDAAKKQPIPTGSSSYTKPKCDGATPASPCIKYDDEVSDAARKIIDAMNKKSVQRMQTASIQYAMEKPTPSANSNYRLNEFYDSLKPAIMEAVNSMIRKT